MSIHKWFVGFFLAVIMVLSLTVNAFLVSARAFQYNLAQVARDTNGVLSLRQMDIVEGQIRQISDATAAQRGERAQIEQRLTAVSSELGATQQRISDATGRLAIAVSTLEERLGGGGSAAPAAALDGDQLVARAAAVISRPGLPAAESQSAISVRQLSQQLRQMEQHVGELQDEQRDLQMRQRTVGGALQESDGAIIALKRTIVGDHYEQYDRVRSEADALRRTSLLGIGSAFVSAHPTFLSTLLVLLMGALGATLYLFPAYMSRPAPVTFAEIAVRTIFGMVTALAFYIVANATLAGLSFVPGQSSSSNAALLNPFTVGLVGIIAGVTADDIAKWIQRRGSEILGGQPGQPPGATNAGFTGVNPHGGPPNV
jgi:hypothetical protein